MLDRATVTLHEPSRSSVITEAVVNAAEKLGLNKAETAKTLCVSPSTVTRYWDGDAEIRDGTSEFKLAVLLVRVFRSLDAVVGGDDASMRSWMTTVNTVLGDHPKTLVQDIEGLVHVGDYLDARRAPV